MCMSSTLAMLTGVGGVTFECCDCHSGAAVVHGSNEAPLVGAGVKALHLTQPLAYSSGETLCHTHHTIAVCDTCTCMYITFTLHTHCILTMSF